MMNRDDFSTLDEIEVSFRATYGYPSTEHPGGHYVWTEEDGEKTCWALPLSAKMQHLPTAIKPGRVRKPLTGDMAVDLGLKWKHCDIVKINDGSLFIYKDWRTGIPGEEGWWSVVTGARVLNSWVESRSPEFVMSAYVNSSCVEDRP